jgi:SAM-dependent methyltransferase
MLYFILFDGISRKMIASFRLFLYRVAQTIFHSRYLPSALRPHLRQWGKRLTDSIERGSNGVGPTTYQTRRDVLLHRIKIDEQDGLEIGPLASPLISRQESKGRISYVDFSPAEASKQKYKDDPHVDIEQIVEPDYLWGDRSLPELVSGKLFDYVVASHVIEHVPDMIGWLQEAAAVLRDGGLLSLAIPDKRFTFDHMREAITPGMLVEAHLLGRRRPSPSAIFDHATLFSPIDSYQAWRQEIPQEIPEAIRHAKDAYTLAECSMASDIYHDVHVNIVTPTSFLLLLEVIARVELLDFQIIEFRDTCRNAFEFFVILERMTRDLNPQKRTYQQVERISQIRASLRA